MNLIKEYLVSVNGAYIYAIIAMLIFLLTFIFMIYQAYSIKKEDVSHYSRLPLDEEDENQ